MDLQDLYLLNLAVTVCMFIVLVVRAWIEYKHFRNMWNELEWRRTRVEVSHILSSEKEMFLQFDRGQELYTLLREIFGVIEE